MPVDCDQAVRRSRAAKATIEFGLVQRSRAAQLDVQLMNRVRNAPRLRKRLQGCPYVAIAGGLFFGGNLHKMTFNAHPPGPVTFQGVVVSRKGLFDCKMG